MEMKGERLLSADRATAWRLLNDSETLKRCLPGCESLTATGPDTYEVVMNAAVGPVKARFKGRMSLTDVEPPSRYRLKFEGQSAQAGFARGEARVELEAVSGEHTRLRYAATSQIGGKLAQIGSRLIDAAAGATAEKFFEAFAAQLAAVQSPSGAEAPPPASAEFGFWRWLVTFLRFFFKRSRGA
jgi:carbon monoxide dehydrogenase subunit G